MIFVLFAGWDPNSGPNDESLNAEARLIDALAIEASKHNHKAAGSYNTANKVDNDDKSADGTANKDKSADNDDKSANANQASVGGNSKVSNGKTSFNDGEAKANS